MGGTPHEPFGLGSSASAAACALLPPTPPPWGASNAGAEAAVVSRPAAASGPASAACLGVCQEEGRQHQRLDSHELDEDVERGARGVLERVAHGVADDGGLRARAAWAAQGWWRHRMRSGGRGARALRAAGPLCSEPLRVLSLDRAVVGGCSGDRPRTLWQSEPLPPSSLACSVAPACGAERQACALRSRSPGRVAAQPRPVRPRRSNHAKAQHARRGPDPAPSLGALRPRSPRPWTCCTCQHPPPPHLDVLLGVVPSAAGVGHGHRHLHAAHQRARQHACGGGGDGWVGGWGGGAALVAGLVSRRGSWRPGGPGSRPWAAAHRHLTAIMEGSSRMAQARAPGSPARVRTPNRVPTIRGVPITRMPGGIISEMEAAVEISTQRR